MLGKAAKIFIISHHLLIEVNSQLSDHISLECPQWDLTNLSSPTILTSFSKMFSYADGLYWLIFIIIITDWRGNPNGMWNLKLKSDIETTTYMYIALTKHSWIASAIILTGNVLHLQTSLSKGWQVKSACYLIKFIIIILRICLSHLLCFLLNLQETVSAGLLGIGLYQLLQT